MKLPAGTKVYIGAPAHPLSPQLLQAIGAALGKLPEIREARLPQVYIPGEIHPSEQVLIIVVEDAAPSPAAKVNQALRAILPSNVDLLVMQWRPNNAMLPTVQSYGCALDLNRRLN